MRVNQQNKTMDIESRDMDYILPSYIRMYLFATKNVDPDRIVFPMFKSVPHPTKPGVRIPVEYVPDMSPEAMEIEADGKDIPKATAEAEAEADRKEDEYVAMKKKIDALEAENKSLKEPTELKGEGIVEEPISPARAAMSAISGVDTGHQPSAARVASAKQPEHPLPPGSESDYGGARDGRDLARTRADLKPEKEINEDEEKPAEDIVKRAKGKKSKES